jgi:hypothetical protein
MNRSECAPAEGGIEATESIMDRSGRAVVIVIIVCALIIGIAFAFYWFRVSPEAASRRAADARYAREREIFTARFDSLKQARLYPTAWRAAPFTKARVDEDRREWILTLSSSDWDRRSPTSKTDLLTKLVTTFEAVRAQAGGDPEDARLVIEDSNGEIMGEYTPEGGALIRR